MTSEISPILEPVLGEDSGEVWKIDAVSVITDRKRKQMNLRAVILLVSILMIQVVVETTEQFMSICVQSIGDPGHVDGDINL